VFLRPDLHDPTSVLGQAYATAIAKRGINKGYVPRQGVSPAATAKSASALAVERQQAIARTDAAV
jgi:hypothetical protein